MKTKVLKLLAYTSRVFTCICFSSFVIELILLVFFSDSAARHPKGFLDRTNIILIAIFFFSLIIVIAIPEEFSKYIPEKAKKPRKPKKGQLQIRILNRNISLRSFLFTLLGILCMLYFIISGPFHGIEHFNKIFRICTILFIPVYPLVYYILSSIFRKRKKDSDYYFKGGDDIAEYLLGLFLGLVISIFLGIIALILFGVIWIIKGIIWLAHSYIGFLLLYALSLLIVVFLSFKTIKNEKS